MMTMTRMGLRSCRLCTGPNSMGLITCKCTESFVALHKLCQASMHTTAADFCNAPTS